MSDISELKNDEKHPSGWDMSQERAFMENLLGQRFNFFLIFFSLVIAGALNTKSMLHLQIVLGIGSTICWLILPTLLRAQQKLDLSLEELFKNSTHPATVLNRLANDQDDNSRLKRLLPNRIRHSRRRLVGKWIPLICCLILTIGFVLAIFEVLSPI